MDKLSCPPQEKLELMQANAALITRDDLFVELAKAYNQARQPEAALKTLAVHDFIPARAESTPSPISICSRITSGASPG